MSYEARSGFLSKEIERRLRIVDDPKFEDFREQVASVIGFEDIEIVNVDTGRYTGRVTELTKAVEGQPGVWYEEGGNGSPNTPISRGVFEEVLFQAIGHLEGKKVYSLSRRAGARHGVGVRVLTPVAEQAMFVTNMFREADGTEDPGESWTVMSMPEMEVDGYEDMGLDSSTVVIRDFGTRTILIVGSGYTGEMKKGIFSVLYHQYYEKDILTMHCSATKRGDRNLLFFGLSGTGKTTLSMGEEMVVVGDDEHGWDENGVFNIENGSYAKLIGLQKDTERRIWDALKDPRAMVENVMGDEKGMANFLDTSKTPNIRASYPLSALDGVELSGETGHPDDIIYLTFDAFGVLPAVSRLNEVQAIDMMINGYTARVAGTEDGADEPEAVFSPFFGGAFLTRSPSEMAGMFQERLNQCGARVWLLNTGFVCGGYASNGGRRIPLAATRAIVEQISTGKLGNVSTVRRTPFNLEVPVEIGGVEGIYLDPRKGWPNSNSYDMTASMLLERFENNLRRYR